MFVPGTSDARLLDEAMRASLSDSLAYVYSLLAENPQQAIPGFHQSLDTLRSRRVAPGVFGRYYKLVLEFQRQNHDEAHRLLQETVAAINIEPIFRVDAFIEADLGDEKHLYNELIDTEAGPVPWLSPPPPDAPLERNVGEALDIIAASCPALAEEIRGLVLQVVGASASKGHPRGFGSVSSFMLWGLVIYNADRYPTPAELVSCLVHEAAHILLFAHSIDEPLVLNDLNARYPSPLRVDPRPMDGVFHATFVSARVHYAFDQLRKAAGTGFAPIEMSKLDDELAQNKKHYFAGLQTVQEHGDLTETGKRILAESLDYMRTA